MTARRRSEHLDPLQVAAVKLGRPPQDPLQAAVILEAWAGRTQVEALPEANASVPAIRTVSPTRTRRSVHHAVDRSEFVILIALLASAFGWIRPLERLLDENLADVVIWCLPLALGLDRFVRVRYLSVDTRAALREEFPRLNLAVALVVGIVSFIDIALVVGLCLMIIWGEAAVFVRRGWTWIYVLVILLTSIWFLAGGDEAIGVMVCAGAVATVANVCAVGATGPRPVLEPWSITLASTLIGLSSGVMITSDISMWRGTDVPTAASVLFVSLTGWWASARLSAIWSELPDDLQDLRLRDRGSWDGFLVRGPVTDALARLIVPTAGILAVYAVLGEWQTAGIVGGFGLLALAMLLTGLVTAARYWAASAAMFVAGAVVSLITPDWWPGATLLVGAAVPALGAMAGAAHVLRQTTAMYATRMMIR